MKKASFPITLFALALCALATPSQAQTEVLTSDLAMVNPTSGPAIAGQRTQRSRSQSSRSSRPSSRATPSRSSSRQSSRPAQRPSSRPAARPAQRPTSRPAARPTQRPTQRPTARPTSRPAQRPTSRPTARPAQRPTSRPAARPAQRPTSQPTARPARRPAQPSVRPSSQPNRSTRPSSTSGRTTPTRTTAPRNTNQTGNGSSLVSPTYRPKPTRTVVPKVSGSTALQRARERARSTSRPKTKASSNNQPTTAQRIQQDRLRRARSASKPGQKSQVQRKVSGSRSKTSTSQPKDKVRASAGASRIQAARDRMRRSKEASAKQTGKSQGNSKLRPGTIKAGGAKPAKGRKNQSGVLNDKGLTVGKGKNGYSKPVLNARETKRKKTARKDYIDSTGRGPIPGGGLQAGAGRPNLDHGSSLSRRGITPGANRGGGAITPGSGHGRNLWRHNNDGYRRDPYSHYYWDWNVWGSGYGWFWCPTQWATACWWDSYWYHGGSWSYGYRPSFYYCGPFTPSYYTVIVQVNETPIAVEQEEAASPPVQVAEAVAPAPAVVPAINRAAEYYLTLGDRAFRAGRYTDAVHHYGKAVEYSPGEGILYLILSDALFATGDYHYGAFTLRKAFDLDPGLVDLTVDKRSFYDRPVDLDAQMTRARTFNLQNPEDNDARIMLIANEVFTGNPAAALSLLRQPQAAGTAQSTAGILLGERARADLEVAQQAVPSDAVFEVVPLGQE